MNEDDFVRLVGGLITLLMVAAIIQTYREMALWHAGPAMFEERDVTDRRFRFGGHHVAVEDDYGVEQGYSDSAVTDYIRPTIDGAPSGQPSFAEIRTHWSSLGRYHGWYSAWVFWKRGTRDSVLYLARRLQDAPDRAPAFEVTRIDMQGRIDRARFNGPQLSQEYRRFRSTQFMQDPWTAFPLSFASLFGMPPLLLVYPIAPVILGLVLLLRRPNGNRARESASP